MSKDSEIASLCRDCIFAKWDESQDPHQQLGCLLGKLDKFEKKELIHNSYYKINNRICIFCRNKEWEDSQWELLKDKGEKISHWHSEYLKCQVDNEAKISLDYILDATSLKIKWKDLDDYLNQLYNIKTLLVAISANAPSEISNNLFQRFKGKEYKTMLVMNDECNIVNEAAKGFKSNYHFYDRINKSFPSLLPEKLNKYVNEELKQVALIEGEGFYCMSNSCWNAVFGNSRHQTAIEKVKILAANIKRENMVISYEDLINV